MDGNLLCMSKMRSPTEQDNLLLAFVFLCASTGAFSGAASVQGGPVLCKYTCYGRRTAGFRIQALQVAGTTTACGGSKHTTQVSHGHAAERPGPLVRCFETHLVVQLIHSGVRVRVDPNSNPNPTLFPRKVSALFLEIVCVGFFQMISHVGRNTAYSVVLSYLV